VKAYLILAVALVALSGCGDSEKTATSDGSPQEISNGSPSTSQPAKPATTPGAYRRVDTVASHKRVPILMYHVIGRTHPGVAFPQLWVAPDQFADHVRALAAAGYTGVTLDNVLDAWGGHARLPAKPIVLSFDDGYIGQGKSAGPVLKAAGWPGVLNLVLHALGTPGGLTKSRIKTMIADGWEVDAHSLTHADMTTLGAAELHNEIAGSRSQIHKLFGVPVSSFCYPAGKFNATVQRAVKAAGYRAATTVDAGVAGPDDDRTALPRIRVNGGDNADAVLRKIRSAGG
jgi:peptidoglycan/xylan/chitin deacetylase (PgdA/CDA1 family)